MRARGKLLHKINVPFGKLAAAWLGFFTAPKEFIGSIIYLEGDSAAVIHCLTAPTNFPTYINPLLADLHQWIRNNPTCKVVHIHREGNIAVD